MRYFKTYEGKPGYRKSNKSTTVHGTLRRHAAQLFETIKQQGTAKKTIPRCASSTVKEIIAIKRKNRKSEARR